MTSAPRVRGLALGAVALVVTAAGVVSGDGRVAVLTAVSVTLAAVAAWRWWQAGRTGVATSAAVASVLVAVLLLEHLTDDVDLVLQVTAVVTLVAGWVLRERRLVVSGVLTLAVLLGRPLPGGETFEHCLLAPSIAIPTPRIDGPLLLALSAVVIGTAMRWSSLGGRPTVARALEATGAVGLVVLLAAKALELPGHRLLCGSGKAIDEGWVVVGIVVGVVAGLYGLAARDLVWEGVGLASITLQGLLATILSGSPWWAAGCALVLVGGLVAAERRGVGWPEAPGYAVARPRLADLRRRLEGRRDRPDP